MSFQKMSFVEPSPWEFYRPEGRGPFPAICLTPLLGRLGFLEDLFLERWFARFFSRHGFAVALIERPFFEFKPPNKTSPSPFPLPLQGGEDKDEGVKQIQKYLEDSISRSVKILDSLLKREDILPHAVGSFGISFGAVVNVLWAARDPRLKAHVFALAGGNIAEIIVTSRDPLMRSYFKAILKAVKTSPSPVSSPPWRGRGKGEGVERRVLLSALKKAISLDPLKIVLSIPRENVLMVLGIFDRVIRFRYGLALRKALGHPETIFLPLGHYPALLVIPLLKWSALNFFKRKLTGISS